VGFSVIVCSCNILTDQDIRELAVDPKYIRSRVAKVYERLGCQAECGRCARTIATIIRESVTGLGDGLEAEKAACLSAAVTLNHCPSRKGEESIVIFRDQ
jgi:bacterioferritin-associated ferredoxin